MRLTQCLRVDLLSSACPAPAIGATPFSPGCESQSSIRASAFHRMSEKMYSSHSLPPKQMSEPASDFGLPKTLLRSIMATFISSADLGRRTTEQPFLFSCHCMFRTIPRKYHKPGFPGESWQYKKASTYENHRCG